MGQLHTKWLEELPQKELQKALAEYRYLVRRFPQWLALTISRTEHEVVRQLLVPNLVEECGSFERASHLKMLDDCLESCGMFIDMNYTPSKKTEEIEKWFYSIFATHSTYISLCVLGPGTEAISQQFLKPLEAGLKNAFAPLEVNLSYFAAHKTELEQQHAYNIEQAMKYLEHLDEDLVNGRNQWTQAGINAHKLFWDGLKLNLAGNIESHLSLDLKVG